MSAYSSTHRSGFTISYRKGTADEAVIAESFEGDILLRHTPEYRIKRDHIIIDVGAHIGCFSLMVAQTLVSGKVYSLEATRETFELLEENVTQNKIRNVSIFHLAMAATNGIAKIYHDPQLGNWGNTITKPVSNVVEEVECISLESFMRINELQHVDFIKFNCEGAEYEILMATTAETLSKIGCMLIAYHGYLEQRYSKTQLAEHLRKNGFRINWRHKNKDDDSGWMIAYKANFLQNIQTQFRTIPLRLRFFRQMLVRKARRAIQIIGK